MVKVFIPRETRAGETRVAATPETVKKLVKAGFAVAVEAGAGAGAFIADEDYRASGAEISAPAQEGWRSADAVLKVRAASLEEAGATKPGSLLIGLLAPYRNPEMVQVLAERKVSSVAMELIPRITRAQPMDALSSQASIAGYKAALLAACRLPRYFPLLMTAAGTVPPARVVVMGAGVAGLQALATARRLGAVVEVSDVREAVKEEVQSLGGRFIELPLAESGEGQGGYAREMSSEFLRRQREIVTRHVAQADAVITTALVPGKPAPRLLTREMVEGMRPGSVVVDLAIEAGGNCELSQADREVAHRGVLVLAPSNLPATLPADASALYARNVTALLLHLHREGRIALDPGDELLAGAVLTHGGEVLNGAAAHLLAGATA